jgi:carbonic anhydrase/acetyltransferase-like protein (isoleucine patch superfamily)
MAIYALGDHVPQIHPNAYLDPAATVIGPVVIDSDIAAGHPGDTI